MTQSTTSVDDKSSNSLVIITKKILRPVGKLFDTILPPYEPRIEIKKKLVQKEQVIEHAIIRHFSEIQLLVGIIAIILGPILESIFDSSYYIFFSIMGLVLVLSAYEMEEIYVTTYRIMVRRVGLVERIIRVPSDEEHALEHVVSFQVGRAPVNIILVVLSILGFSSIFITNLTDFMLLVAIIPSTVILLYGLRINRRALTLHLAGGLSVILGVRKGVPKRIITAIQISIYEDQPKSLMTERPEMDEEYTEKPAKSLDE